MADGQPGSRVAELLERRIDELTGEVRAGFALCATKTLSEELAYRLEETRARFEESLARIHQLEMQIAHLEHPARPRKVNR